MFNCCAVVVVRITHRMSHHLSPGQIVGLYTGISLICPTASNMDSGLMLRALNGPSLGKKLRDESQCCVLVVVGCDVNWSVWLSSVGKQ